MAGEPELLGQGELWDSDRFREPSKGREDVGVFFQQCLAGERSSGEPVQVRGVFAYHWFEIASQFQIASDAGPRVEACLDGVGDTVNPYEVELCVDALYLGLQGFGIEPGRKVRVVIGGQIDLGEVDSDPADVL